MPENILGDPFTGSSIAHLGEPYESYELNKLNRSELLLANWIMLYFMYVASFPHLSALRSAHLSFLYLLV